MADVLERVEAYDGGGSKHPYATLPMLYSRTATGALQTWLCWTAGPEVFVRYGKNGGAQQEAHFTCEAKNEGRANETTAPQQAVKEAIAKWKKQVKKKYHWDPNALSTSRTTAPKLVSELKPMLAHKWDDHKHKVLWPLIAQPKLDGLRCLVTCDPKIDGTVLRSRGGETYKLPHLIHALAKPFAHMLKLGVKLPYFDGEIYTHGLTLQEINSLARDPREESEVLQFHCYDAVYPHDMSIGYQKRMDLLTATFEGFTGGPLQLVRHNVCEDIAQVKASLKQFLRQGYEGAILRDPDGVYRFGYRSASLLKYKVWKDAEFPIIGFTPGKGKNEQVPTFRCVTDEGVEFDCTPKGTAKQRADLLKRAPALVKERALLKVQYAFLSPDGAPLYPRGLGIRDKGDL